MVYSNCHWFRFLLVIDYLFIFRIALWPSAEKKLTWWFSACAPYRFAVLIVCVLSRFVFGAECATRLYWFLIIASSFTFIQ